MTEPAVLALKLRSHPFDSSHSRDRWPRLQFAYTYYKATVTTVGSSPRASDHKCIYRAMLMVQFTGAFSELIPTLRRAKDVNYADRSCWNGRSCLSDRTLYQRRDDPWCGAIVSSGKLLDTRSLITMCFSTFDEERQLLIISNINPGQACTHSTRPSDHCRRLQRRRQPKVRPPRHRHRHLHSHRAKPNTLDQSSSVRPSTTLCTSRVRRTTTASTSQRPSRSAADDSVELAATLQKQHRAYRVCVWHLLRALPAWRSAESFDCSQYGLSRRGQLYFRCCKHECRVSGPQSI